MKEFLSQQGIAYEERDIRADERWIDELIRMGHRATPVTLIDGEACVGDDKECLARLLGLER